MAKAKKKENIAQPETDSEWQQWEDILTPEEKAQYDELIDPKTGTMKPDMGKKFDRLLERTLPRWQKQNELNKKYPEHRDWQGGTNRKGADADNQVDQAAGTDEPRDGEPTDHGVQSVIEAAKSSGADQGTMDWLVGQWTKWKNERPAAVKRREIAREVGEHGIKQSQAELAKRQAKAPPSGTLAHLGGNPGFAPDEQNREGQNYIPGDREDQVSELDGGGGADEQPQLASLSQPDDRTRFPKRLPATPDEWHHWEKSLAQEDQQQLDDLTIEQAKGGRNSDTQQKVDSLILRSLPGWWKQKQGTLTEQMGQERRARTFGDTPELTPDTPTVPTSNEPQGSTIDENDEEQTPGDGAALQPSTRPFGIQPEQPKLPPYYEPTLGIWGQNEPDIESRMRDRYKATQFASAHAFLNHIAPPQMAEGAIAEPARAKKAPQAATKERPLDVDSIKSDLSKDPEIQEGLAARENDDQEGNANNSRSYILQSVIEEQARRAFQNKFGRPPNVNEEDLLSQHTRRHLFDWGLIDQGAAPKGLEYEYSPNAEPRPTQIASKGDPNFEQYDKDKHESERDDAVYDRYNQLNPKSTEAPSNKNDPLWQQAQAETDDAYDKRFRNAFKYWENEYRHLKQTMKPEDAMDHLAKRMDKVGTSLNMLLSFDKWRQKNDDGEKLTPKDRRSELESEKAA